MSIEKIDHYLYSLAGREIASVNEVRDLLLDLRLDICAMRDAQGDAVQSIPSATPVHYAPNL